MFNKLWTAHSKLVPILFNEGFNNGSNRCLLTVLLKEGFSNASNRCLLVDWKIIHKVKIGLAGQEGIYNDLLHSISEWYAIYITTDYKFFNLHFRG